jgi:gas vesicle protein
MNDMTDVSNAMTQVAGMPLLGHFVGWHLAGGAAKQDAVEDLLAQFNLKEDLKLPKVGPTTAYRRAVLEATRGKRAEKEYETIKIAETEESITHAVVRTETLDTDQTVRDGNGELVLRGDLNIDVEFRVGFDKARRDSKNFTTVDLIRFEDEAVGHRIAAKIVELYSKRAVEYSSNDLRLAFQAAFRKWHGFTALSQGALWFLPLSMEHKVRDWEEMMVLLGHQPLVIPVPDAQGSKDQLRNIALNTLDGQLKEVKDELKKFRESAKTRATTVEKRLEVLDDIKAKARLYQKLLGAEISELDEMIVSSQNDIMQALREMAD